MVHAIAGAVLGQVVTQVGSASASSAQAVAVEPGEYPLLARAIAEIPGDLASRFDFALEALIAGFDARCHAS